MNYLDHVARLAAAEAAAAAQAIFDQRPNLTAAERNVVVGNSLARAHKDYLGSYVPAEADAAFRRAVDAVCKEIESGSIEQPDDFGEISVKYGNDYDPGISPREAARMLYERRRAGR